MKLKETESHVIMESENKSGATFEVGYPKASGYEADTLHAAIKATSDTPSGFKILRWVPAGESYISPGAEDIGIRNGYVSHDRGPVYSYRINFLNSKGWGFDFADESGNAVGIYHCTTIRNGWHYIDYNSDSPIIVGVK